MSVVTLPKKSLKYMDEDKIEVDIPESTIKELNSNLEHSKGSRIIAGEKVLNWNDLYGIAKDIWINEDAQDYITELREDR